MCFDAAAARDVAPSSSGADTHARLRWKMEVANVNQDCR